MNPGRLREKIIVQKRASNSVGSARSPEDAETPWQDEFTDKAKPSFRGQQSQSGQGGTERPEQRVTFLVRSRSEYRDPAIQDKRIVWEGRAYEVENVEAADHRRRYLTVNTLYTGEAA